MTYIGEENMVDSSEEVKMMEAIANVADSLDVDLTPDQATRVIEAMMRDDDNEDLFASLGASLTLERKIAVNVLISQISLDDYKTVVNIIAPVRNQMLSVAEAPIAEQMVTLYGLMGQISPADLQTMFSIITPIMPQLTSIFYAPPT